jgi:hypothetical protein
MRKPSPGSEIFRGSASGCFRASINTGDFVEVEHLLQGLMCERNVGLRPSQLADLIRLT